MALTTTQLIVALTILVSHLIDHTTVTAIVASDQESNESSLMYVIKDEPGASSSSLEAKQWNKQRVAAASSSGKQIFYTDHEPVSYYHSYKFLGPEAHAYDMEASRQVAGPYGPAMELSHYGPNYGELPWYMPLRFEEGEVSSVARSGYSGVKGRQPHSRSRDGATKSGRRRGGSKTSGSRPRQRPVQHTPPLALAPGGSAASDVASFNATQRRRARSNKKNLVCYYGTWAVYRPDAGRYPVENIDPFLCTHIIYGFTGLSYDNLIKPLDPWNDLEDNYGKGAMKRFTNLKRINPDLKALVAIGGWNEGSIKYSKMASEPESRARFVRSVVDFLGKFNFDGLDLDWEYPGARGGKSYDKQNFVRLLRELKTAFEPHGYLLTAAVSAGKWFIDPAYDIGQVSKYLDLINLMAYDYHGGWETKTGMNAPLFHSAKHDTGKDEALLNVNWSVNYWLQQGAAPEKIMLGVGSYGRSFTLDKASVNGINAPASQKGQAGPYTREPGSLGYNEICESFQRQPGAWTIVRDPDYLAPYAYNERQWVGYDDMQSLALKAQFAKSMGLGGMMMWSIETDDFNGRCHNQKYPLLNTIKRVLEGGPAPPIQPTARPPPSGTTKRPGSSSTRRPASGTTSTTTSKPGHEVEEDSSPRPPASSSTTRRPATGRPTKPGRPIKPSTGRPVSISTTSTSRRPQVASTSTTTRRPATQQPTGEFVCRADGMFADPRNCRKFIRCVSSGNTFALFRFDCGPGTAFNEAQQYCDHIYNVPNCAKNQRQTVLVGNQNWPLQQIW